MPIYEKTGLNGLVTNVAETQAPPGTLIEAENVVMRRPGCIEPRDGFQLVQTLASGFAAYGFSWRSKDWILRNNGSNVFDWRDTTGGTYQVDNPESGGASQIDPQPFRRDIFARAEARANLYVPFDSGVLKRDVDTGAWQWSGLAVLAEMFEGYNLSTAGSWLADDEQAAYRIVCVKKDANGVQIRSAPTGAVVVKNESGAARAIELFLSSTGTHPFDSFEIYRTRNFPISVTPDEEYQLVDVLPSDDALTYVDLVLPSARGTTLYTSPSRGGANERNDRPPACACTALFRGSLFFANTRGPRSMRFSLNVYESGSSANDKSASATGIGVRSYNATATSGTNTLTGLSSTVGLQKGMVVVSGHAFADTWITNISGTTLTLNQNVATSSGGPVAMFFYDAIKVGAKWVKAVDFSNSVLKAQPNFWQAYYVTPPEPGYVRTVQLEKISRSAIAESIQATHGDEYRPALPKFDDTPLALSQDAWPGGYAWSKPDEPEHVRPIDYGFVGDQNKAILALVPTRDALYFVKEDGLFRLTGANGVWRVDPVDPTVRCVLPSSVRSLRGRGVFLGDRGVAIVSEDGSVELASAPVNDQLKPLIDQVLANWISTGFYELTGMQGASVACVFERESEYTLARGSATAPLVFNDVTGAWTTLAYYGHANESLSYKALFNFERHGHCVLSMGVSYFKTLLSTDAGADYLRYDRATAVTVNSYTAPNATLSASINALEDDVIKDSAGRYWRITAAVNNSATVPVTLAGGTASMATGAGTLYRSLRCSVTATGFAIPRFTQKHWGAFNTAWTKLVGVVRLRYGYQSSESATFVEENAYTSLAQTASASGNGVTNYTLGLAPPARVPTASARAWLLRARVRWAMPHGYAQLEGISAELLSEMPASAKQQVAA